VEEADVMAGSASALPDGIITLQARQLGDGSVGAGARRRAGAQDAGRAAREAVGRHRCSRRSDAAVGATHALVFVETNTVRFYDDGSTPTTGTTGNGAPLAAGNALELDMATFANFKMIAETGTATVHVLYYRYGA
jgi:hypothetical protein